MEKLRQICQSIREFPTRCHRWVQRIVDKFGWKFVLICFAVYGLNQGLGEGWYYPAQSYYFKDVLNASPVQANSYTAVTHVPWTIKPVYGALSDCFPILGYHRTFYTTISSAVGTTCWILLGLSPGIHGLALLLMVLGNFSLAWPEVMIDAVVAERSKRYVDFASDLQSFNYGSLAIGGVFGTLSSGFLISCIGPQALLGLISITSAAVLITSVLWYLGEGKRLYIYEPLHEHVDEKKNAGYGSESNNDNVTTAADNDMGRDNLESYRDDNSLKIEPFKTESETRTTRSYSFRNDATEQLTSKPVFVNKNGACVITLEFYRRNKQFVLTGLWIALLVASVAIVLSVTQDIAVIAPVTVVIIVSVLATLRYSLYDDHPVLIKAIAFVFLRECLQPNVDTAFFYWYTDAPGGPHFSTWFVGIINTMAYIAMIVGIFFYAAYIRYYSYRSIFFLVQIALFFTNLLDLCLVTRVNLAIGIPDAVFILGDSTIGPVVKRLYLMPMFVMASKLCPDGTEATLFSVMMSLSNFGYDCGSVFGTILLESFHVTDDDWRGFIYVLMIKSIMRLVPILLIPILVPMGCPEDSQEVMLNPDEEALISSVPTGNSSLDTCLLLDASHRSSDGVTLNKIHCNTGETLSHVKRRFTEP